MFTVAHTMPFMITNHSDINMATNCFKSLSSSTTDSILIIYNQGNMSNENLEKLLKNFKLNYVILGEGYNVGIPAARQCCFKYIWNNFSGIKYISEIHVDMIFTSNWVDIIISYLENHDEPMLSPGIITNFGEMHPENRGNKSIEIPQSYEEILTLLSNNISNEICEGFVHPVIHKSEVLKTIGGYDIRFLKGKQGYEDDSILLGYRYYMGTRSNWRPKTILSTRVFHYTLAQRLKMENIYQETNRNLGGLVDQYGAYGLLQLSLIHDNNKFEKIVTPLL